MSDEKHAHHDSEDEEARKRPQHEEEELELPPEVAEDVKGGASTSKPAPSRFYIK